MKKQYSELSNRIVIPIGDPAGIGIEITLKALQKGTWAKEMKPILVGCKKTLKNTYIKLKAEGITSLASPDDFEIEDIGLNESVKLGEPSAASGEASFKWLTHGTKYLIKTNARALITAPIAKHAWHEAGHYYPGQTERIAEIAGISNPSMLFTALSPITGWRFNTLLATTHTPFIDIGSKLNSQIIKSKIETLLAFCKRYTKHPKIAIAGLNPHAGENGSIGEEEIQWIIPLLKQLQQEHPDISLQGPMLPDTCWIPASKAWNSKDYKEAPDGILALYHDQGLIPTKLIAFDSAVNTTLGLPFIRTSPDHGTAFDIAGQGSARSTSMEAAIQSAWDLTK